MTARRRDEDGYGPDASHQPHGQRETSGPHDVREGSDTPPGMLSATDLGDARPVSLLGLRMSELEGDRDVAVSRRSARLRPGGGRPDGMTTRPAGGGAQMSPHPPGGDARPEGRGGEPSDAGSGIAGSGIPGARGAGARGAGPGGGTGKPEPPAVPDRPVPRTPAALGRPPVQASAASGWTPDVGEFRPRPSPVPAGSPEPEPGGVVAQPGGTQPGDVVADRVVAGRGDPGTLVARCRWVHVGGLEDGCGRTTVTAGLAMALAASRRDRIIAVDVCPDQPGMLAARLGPSSGYGPGHGPGHAPGRGDLARAGGLPAPLLPEVRRFVPSAGRTGRTGPAGQGSGPVGLDVLLGAPGADVFGRSVEEVGRALDVVEDWYEVALVDSPPGWGRPLPAALLARADTLVVAARAGFVTLSAVDDALAALADSGRGDLADSVAIAVVETVPTRWSGRARRRLARLAERAHSIVVVPFDPMLADGRPFTWSGLRRRTRAAFGELAAAVEAGPG